MSVRKISNVIFIVGLLVCGIGLVYVLGYSNDDIFKYASGGGFLMMAVGIFMSMFEKSKK